MSKSSNRLPSEMSIYTAAEFRGQCLGWLAQSPPETGETGQGQVWHVNAGDVDQVDAAGIQLLLALQKTLQAQQSDLQLGDPSSALSEACTAMGLSQWLESITVTGDDE